MNQRPFSPGFRSERPLWDSRRDPLDGADIGLPPLDVDLAALAEQTVGAPPPKGSAFNDKKRQISQEFIGLSSLSLLNACLIACLRKRAWPDRAPALFVRLWQEQGPHLLSQLDPRWKVSSLTTFAEHGASEAQRRLGLAGSMLFGMMKIYETERLFSGTPPAERFRRGNRSKAPLPLAMDPYALRNGGLDVNLLVPLWLEAEAEPVAGPLAQDLLSMLAEAEDTVFARLAEVRRRLPPKEAS